MPLIIWTSIPESFIIANVTRSEKKPFSIEVTILEIIIVKVDYFNT